MRHFKLKLFICWQILTDNYCNSTRQKCWWLFPGKLDQKVIICFGNDHYHMLDGK